MLYIYNVETNPYFNLAAEEYVMQHFSDEMFMLWRNAPSIIIGKFQNALAEINTSFTEAHSIPVVRRMSGGGAVFHDLGNLNFTFVRNGARADFKGFVQPVVSSLNQLGVPAVFQGRNDLAVNDMKISGNAEYIFNGRTLHHGTLLFSAKMDYLAEALKVNPLKFQDKAVKSVRKRVANIADFLDKPMSVTEFADYLLGFVNELYPDSERYFFSEKDMRNIEKLQKEKYETWDWNFGSSPAYSFSKSMRTKGGTIEVCADFVKSHIAGVKFYGDFFTQRELSEFENLFVGCRHSREAVEALLDKVDTQDYIVNVTNNDILDLFF